MDVPRVHDDAEDLIDDADVDAVYIATPPSSHCDLALKVAAAGKPCLVEKPMAMNHAECLQMVEAFRAAQRPLWVAYYRRALPRFLKVRELLRARAIGTVDVDSRQGHRPARSRRCREGMALQHRDRGRGAVSRSRLALLRHHRFSGGANHGGGRFRAEHGRHAMPPRTSPPRRFRSATRSPAPASGISMRRCRPTRSCSPAPKGTLQRRFSPTRMWSSREAANPISIGSAILPTYTSR